MDVRSQKTSLNKGVNMKELEKLEVILDYKIALLEAEIKDFKEIRERAEKEQDNEKIRYWQSAIERNDNIKYGLRQAKEAIATLK